MIAVVAPQNQTEPKKPQFFMATPEDLKQGYKAKIFNAEAYLYCLIRAKRAAGWEWYLNVKQFCAEWEIRESTFYRALSKLRVKNLISWRTGDNTVVVWWDKKVFKIANIDSSDSANSPNLDTAMALQDIREPLQDVREPLQDVREPLQDVREQNAETLALSQSCNPSYSLQIDSEINTDFHEQVCVVFEKVSDQDPECDQQKFHHHEHEINQDPIPEPPTTLLDEAETLQVVDTITHEDQGSAAPRHKTLQKQEWQCPGSDEDKYEFLKYKGRLLVEAKKCKPVEARTAALAWANRNPESANLLWEDWQHQLKQQKATQNTALAVVPDFYRMPSEEHASLVEKFIDLGGEAFIKLCSWHKYWLQFAATPLGQKRVPGMTTETVKKIREALRCYTA